MTSFTVTERRQKIDSKLGKGDSDFDGSGATLGWRADVLWIVGTSCSRDWWPDVTRVLLENVAVWRM